MKRSNKCGENLSFIYPRLNVQAQEASLNLQLIQHPMN